MAITVQCPSCTKQHTVGESMYGKRAQCPCGGVVQVPAGPTHVPTSSAPSIPVRCLSCGKQHMAGSSLFGKAVRCPCGGVLQVPAYDPLASDFGGGSSVFDALSEYEKQATASPPRSFGQPSYGAPPSPYGVPQHVPPQPPRPSDDQVLAGHLQDESWRKPDRYSQVEGEGGLFSSWGGILNGGLVFGLITALGGMAITAAGLYFGFLLRIGPVLIIVGLIGMVRGLMNGN